VPERASVQLQAEFDAIQSWAVRNNMFINLTETFHRPNPRMVLDITTLPGIEIGNEIKILCVLFCDVVNFDSHVNFVLDVSSQRPYLIKKLRDQRLSLKQL
jgi:hypothetical protein